MCLNFNKKKIFGGFMYQNNNKRKMKKEAVMTLLLIFFLLKWTRDLTTGVKWTKEVLTMTENLGHIHLRPRKSLFGQNLCCFMSLVISQLCYFSLAFVFPVLTDVRCSFCGTLHRPDLTQVFEFNSQTSQLRPHYYFFLSQSCVCFKNACLHASDK